jgi:hypothetical protein
VSRRFIQGWWTGQAPGFNLKLEDYGSQDFPNEAQYQHTGPFNIQIAVSVMHVFESAENDGQISHLRDKLHVTDRDNSPLQLK